MKKEAKKDSDELREEYDFSRGERGKYASRYAQGSNVVVLDPDVAAAFPNADCCAISSSSAEAADWESVHSSSDVRTNYGLCSTLSIPGPHHNKSSGHC